MTIDMFLKHIDTITTMGYHLIYCNGSLNELLTTQLSTFTHFIMKIILVEVSRLNMINICRKIKMKLENIPDDPMIPATCPLVVPGSSPMMIPAGLGFGGGGLGFSFGLGGRTSI